MVHEIRFLCAHKVETKKQPDMYNKEDVKKMNSLADIREFIPGLSGLGIHKYRECPFCGKSGKSKGLVTYKPKGGLAESAAFCHACEKGFSSATDAVMYFDNLTFPEAVKYVAEKTGYLIDEEAKEQKPMKKVQTVKKKEEDKPSAPKRRRTKSFCERQLEASGLTIEDVTATVRGTDGSEIQVPTFVRGGYDTSTWTYNLKDDEMLIFYYDLQGDLVRYASRGAAGRQKDYVRVRWSNPDLHKNMQGKGIKYQTPPNAQSKLYFPQVIRTYYKNATPLETLIIQEGEKKAEKACKHGIPSIAIQGINNIGNKETGIIQDLQYLVQRCQIKKVVLLFDSDWDHLSSSLSANDTVDKRPKSFAGAAKKFRTYVESMQNVNVSVDVYMGHINENENDEKGIDDLLCGSLKGQEHLLAEDITRAMLAHDGKSQYVNIHKISTLSDYQIDSFWNLREPEKFFERYRAKLEPLGRFRINHMTYYVEEGKLKVATKYDSDNELWNVDIDDKGKKTVSFVNREMLKFVAANGFYRIHTADLEKDDYKFVHVEDNIVKQSGINEIRNFVYQFVEDNCKDEDVKEYFSSKVEYVMSNGKLSLLKMIDDNFDVFNPITQRFYYENGCVEVTADSIEKQEQHAVIWEDKIIKRQFRRCQIFKSVKRIDNENFEIQLTPEGEKCEFLRFLRNTSNFWSEQDYVTEEQTKLWSQHLMNKITSIGYLLNDFKFQTELKAVIAMDGQMGDIGQSNGRTGKSLIGMALNQMMEQTTIDGRNTKNDDDFLYSNVTPQTRNIFLDDVKVNFDFGRFFFAITGDLQINPKGMARYTIRQEKSPKFYITTNHAINAVDRSSMERITFISFSDFYNDAHRPIDDFGHSFFVDWSEEEWMRFDNLMCECNQLYLRSMAESWYRIGQGAIQPPMDDIIQRTLLQQMGSAFHQWAETYFDETAGHLNIRIKRKDMYDAYHSEFSDNKFGVTANNFKTKLILYCRMKLFDLNARRPNERGISFFDFVQNNPNEVFVGGMDKSNGFEYFTVSTREKSKNGIL